MALNLNVLGGELRACCFDPITGFYRDGSCRTGEEDPGTHVVCARMTVEFLNFSVERGNDLVTPRQSVQGTQARRPLVPVRPAVEGGVRGRLCAAGGARRHARARPRLRFPRRPEAPRRGCRAGRGIPVSWTLEVRHVTEYRYANPVSFGEHRLMFRPRAGHDIRVLDDSLTVSPEADVHWIQDVFSNSVAL
jgi:uncharacterized protein (DUF2237 family)